ncbi:MAG: two-component regulator propeller domain-containing protein, partial [Anaerolineae bacterium]
MNQRRTASGTLKLRILFVAILILGVILINWPASPTRPRSTTAQGVTPFPPEGDWYTYANGDDILTLELQGDVLWAGTRAGGVVRWNTTDGAFVQYLKPQDGLVGNTVRDIVIDSEGNKWFATNHGLSALNDNGTPEKGDDVWYTFTRATTAGNLPSDRVSAVAFDEAGYLWIGTAQDWDSETSAYVGGGLAKVDTKGTLDPTDDEWLYVYTVDNTITHSHGDVTLGLASDNITDILPVAGNRVWVATGRQWVFNPPTQNDPVGHWVQLYGGLSRLDHAGTTDAEDDDWETWNCEESAHFGCVVSHLKLDANGYVWSTMRGKGVLAFRYDDDRALDYVQYKTTDGLPTNDVDAIVFGPSNDPQWQNTVWFSTYSRSSDYGRGVVMLDHAGTIMDKGDDLWNDLTRVPAGPMTTENGLPDDRVQAMVVGDPSTGPSSGSGGASGQGSKIWMGTGGIYGMGHGIAAYDLAQKTFAQPLTTVSSVPSTELMTGLPYNYITDLAVGQEGTRWENYVWVGTGNKRERKYGAGALLLNTQGTRDPSDDTWTRFTKESTDDDGEKPWTGLASNNITALVIDGDYVWFGTQPATWDPGRGGGWTDGGLSVYDGEQWTIRTDDNTGGQYAGMLDDRISALAIGCEGKLWIALGSLRDNSGLGFNILDTMGDPHDLSNDEWGTPIQYTTIPSNLVTGIATDCAHNQLWIATSPFFTGFGTQGGGVARYEYDTGRWTSWIAR